MPILAVKYFMSACLFTYFLSILHVIPEAATKGFYRKKVFLKINRKTPAPESLIYERPATLFKKRLWHRYFSCEFCKILKNTFFTEHLLRMAASVIPPEKENINV